MLAPGALSGTRQVIESFSCPAATGCRLPHHVSWQNTEAVPSIFRPLMVTPLSSSSITRSVGGVCRWLSAGPTGRQPCGLVTVWEAKNIVSAHMLVIITDVAAEALPDAVEHRRSHHQPAHITREVIGRTTEQAVRP